MFTKLPSRRTIVVGLLLTCLTLIIWFLVDGYTAKTAWLQTMKDALLTYAEAHDGKFPNQDGDPLKSLDLLLDQKYLHHSNILAGFTGQVCKDCESFCAKSSWVYVPGLTTNSDPNIAIIWDRKIGLDWSGRKSGMHYFIPVCGEMRAVPKTLWNQFLVDQENLRKTGR